MTLQDKKLNLRFNGGSKSLFIDTNLMRGRLHFTILKINFFKMIG